MKKIAILTSGGDAPGMNAAIRATVRSAISNGMEVYGVYHGYQGLIEDRIVEFGRDDVGNVLQRGGTILRTSRSTEFMTSEGQDIAANNLKKRGITALVAIGGDGTLRGLVNLVERGIQCMLIPATIDNDIACTDYSIGFDTAVNTVLDIIGKLRDTAASHEKATVVQVMGRDCGDIAVYSGIAGGADAILVPEVELDIKHVCEKIVRGQSSGKHHSIVIAAEGISMPFDELIETLKKETGSEVRVVIPGYIQRGGMPTAKDRILASMLSARAIDLVETTRQSFAVGEIDGVITEIFLHEATTMKKEFNRTLYEFADEIS